MSRARWIAIAVAAAVVVIAGVLWWGWAPRMASSAIVSRAERVGLQAQVEGVRVGWFETGIRRLSLVDGDALHVVLEDVRVTVPLWRARDVHAIQRVELGRVTVSGTPEALGRVRGRFKGRVDIGAAPSQAASNDEAAPSVALHALSVRLRDEYGPLVEADGEFGRDAAGVVDLAFSALRLGAKGHDRFVGKEFEARLRGRRLQSVRLETGFAVLDASDGTARLPGRLRQALRSLSGGESASGEESGDANGESAPLDRLANDFVLDVMEVAVEDRTGEPLVDAMSIQLAREGDSRLRFRAEASGRNGGHLSADMNLSLDELRLQGSVAFGRVPLSLVAPFLEMVPWHGEGHGEVGGALLVSATPTGILDFEGRLVLNDAAFYSARLAPHPIENVSLSFDGKGKLMPLQRRVELSEAVVKVGEASVTLAGAAEWAPEHFLFELDASLPSTRCDRALASIPAGLLDDLVGFSWSGAIAGSVRLHLDSRSLDEAELKLHVLDNCRFDTVPAVADLRRYQQPFSHRVAEPDDSYFEMEAGPGSSNWTSIDAMSPYFVHAVLAHEDAAFFSHSGFAPWAIRDALVRNIKERRYVVGASTISMQLAKNLFLHREKYLARKVQEVLLTWWLESALEKKEILELYLNIIEYGPSVYGITAASQHYFSRPPSELSPAEAAFLATILPGPKAYADVMAKGLSKGTKSRVQRLLVRMHAKGWIDDAALAYGTAEVESFRFGHGDPSRVVAGSAAPLPYQAGAFDEWERTEESWVDDAQPVDTIPPQ